MTESHAAPSEPSFCVLIVDDSPDDRAEARRLLLRGTERRYLFHEAATGSEALQALVGPESILPDCVLLDHTLPDMDATEVLAALMKEDGQARCPVVVLTGSVDAEVGHRVMRAGAQDYLGKAWLTPEALTRAVDNALDRMAMTRVLIEQRKELEASEARYRELYESAFEHKAQLRLALQATRTGIWSWSWQTDSVQWSPECYEIHGVDPSTFAGTGEAFFTLVHPADRQRVDGAVRAAISKDALYHCEFRVIRPDGNVVWVENLGRLVPGHDGQSERMLGTLTDISERRRVADQLARSEANLARAQRAARVGAWDWNIRTNQATWTDEAYRLFGRTPGDRSVTLESWLDCLHPEDRALAAQRAQNVGADGRYADVFRILHPNGSVRWLEAVGELLLDDDGRPERLLGTVRDVTERHEADSALRAALLRAEQEVLAREQLVYVVSHDLRTPLGVIKLAAHSLTQGLEEGGEGASPARTKALAASMARQTRRMERLIDELLDVAQLHAGQPLAMHVQVIDLNLLVRGAVEEHQSVAPDRTIQLGLPDTPSLATCDPRRMERVVNNLLSNALKYSHPASTIVVAVERKQGAAGDSWLTLQVKDKGIGIAKADLEHIFTWFGRGRNAQSTAVDGSGVGLAGVKQIVEQHGGAIAVESQEGQGSTFTVQLPALPPKPDD